MDANQVVALNLRRAREEWGQTQELAAQRLAQYLGGKPWSKKSFSAAERSADEGARPREFSANELLAFSCSFEKPLSYFFTLPPGVEHIYAGRPIEEAKGIGRKQLLEAIEPLELGEDHASLLRQIADAIERRELGRRMTRAPQQTKQRTTRGRGKRAGKEEGHA